MTIELKIAFIVVVIVLVLILLLLKIFFEKSTFNSVGVYTWKEFLLYIGVLFLILILLIFIKPKY